MYRMNIQSLVRSLLALGLMLQAITCFCQEGKNPRTRENFNGGWLFARQAHGTGELGSFDRQNGEAVQIEPRFRNARQPNYDDSSWEQVTIPHTWNAHDTTDEKPGYWRGIGWYRKHFFVDPKFSGKRIFLEFEGVNSVSEFWLNGQRIGEHKGGYTGFEFDITNQVKYGTPENVLTVKVDNLFHPTVPPTVKTDINFYGGIYRYVWLRFTAPAYISQVAWTTPSVSERSAEIHTRSVIVNKDNHPGEFTLVQEIFSPSQQLVKSFSSPAHVPPSEPLLVDQKGGSLESPLLWSPDTPNVYRIRTTLREGDHVVDAVENPLGFRWYRFDPQRGLILNGQHVQMRGTNWHQVYPGLGNALPKSRHTKDMEFIRDMGVNFWRTSHYPHDVATMDASDRLGLMVWEELPVMKEIGDADEYIANVSKMAQEMIDRDRDHPSVFIWGIAGEVNAPVEVRRRVVKAVLTRYKELDPTRPTGMHYPDDDQIDAMADVVGRGWLYNGDEYHQKFPTRSYIVAEFSVASSGRGIYGMGPVSEDLACEKHEDFVRQLNARPWLAGAALWHQFDYDGETYDPVIPHIVSFGVADVWRIPKDSYYFYQSQWTTKPMVHIVGHWTWPGDDGKSKSVKVYSNTQEVELLLNGKSLGVKKDAPGLGLLHPPRIWEVPYEPGTLKAVARNQGAELVDERKTAGPAHHIVLQSDTEQLETGNPESLAYITAQVVDDQGTVVPSASNAITFTLYGAGELLEQTWLGHGTGYTWNVVAGLTRIAFRATQRSGEAVVSAYSPGLGMGRIKLRVSAKGKPDEMSFHGEDFIFVK